MKTRIATALFVTIALSLGCFSQAHAYCDDFKLPTTFKQEVPQADGSKAVLFAFQDQDYYPGGAISLYQNGRLIQTATNGYIQRIMPKGAGTYQAYGTNYDTCGRPRYTVPAGRVTN